MRLMMFRSRGDSTATRRFGIVEGDAVADLSGRLSGMAELIRRACAGDEIDIVGVDRFPLTSVDFLPPTDGVGRVFCVGLNYARHVAETGRSAGDHPSLFLRLPTAQVGHRQAIMRPAVSDQFDFEGELAVVIGRGGHRIDRADAMDHVAGYCCFADNSVRDWQRHAAQVTPGKNFDQSGAAGPWVVTRDAAPAPAEMMLTTRLNGRVMQQDTPGDLVFPIDQLIAYISGFTRLQPGDLIATGSPEGVGMARDPQVWMRPGDRLEVEISGIGVLSNPVVQEPAGGTGADAAEEAGV